MQTEPGPPDPATGTDYPALRRVQRRVVVSILVVQAVFFLVFAMTGPLVSLIAERMTGSARGAGFAQALIFCGGVLVSIPLAALSAKRGRRAGIATGYLAGAAGSALVVVSATVSSYPLLLLGALGVGAALAAGLQARFAVTDLADADRIGRSMGILSWSAITGSVLGPPLAGGVEQLGAGSLAEFTAPFAAVAAGLAVAGLLVLVALRPDPLLLARSMGREPVRKRRNTRAALRASLRNPVIRRGIAVVVTVHTAMISLMNMAPIHLSHGAVTLTSIGLVIGAHSAAMYLPGPVVGYLSDRLGPYPLLVTGLGVMATAAFVLAMSPAGDTVMVGLGLTLLGVGWAAGYLAGSVLITSATEGQLRTMAQGASDFFVQLAAALGALLAGVMAAALGYDGLSIFWLAVIVALLFRILAVRPAATVGPTMAAAPSGPESPGSAPDRVDATNCR
ncbi:MFS transporter [Micromonospora sp. NBC_01796]|uniref:MFS transporter n=1 Tax=Micromonospora sp. NBC_01796 TaxID=2975987 RepID=UPI002DD9D3A6|nr:MFS transporter [Micromonospora sp. NBC_01796]WSA86581.1 MFS transporter [Micromonospora sp. NBC_01796]